MNDHELKALSAFVLAEALCRHADDQGRLSNGQSIGYGDMSFPEKDALQSELARRASAPVSQTDSPWTGHARVELMGHRSYLGRIRGLERYGAHLGEVQVLLASGEYGDVHQFGGKSVYEIREITLEAALTELRQPRVRSCAGKYCYANVIVEWGHPSWDDSRVAVLCEKCKAEGRGNGETKEEEKADADIPIDEVGTVHGPAKCPKGACSECSGDHHWLECCPDPNDLGEYADHPAVKDHALAGFFECKHCDAWAEMGEPLLDSSSRLACPTCEESGNCDSSHVPPCKECGEPACACECEIEEDDTPRESDGSPDETDTSVVHPEQDEA